MEGGFDFGFQAGVGLEAVEAPGVVRLLGRLWKSLGFPMPRQEEPEEEPSRDHTLRRRLGLGSRVEGLGFRVIRFTPSPPPLLLVEF